MTSQEEDNGELRILDISGLNFDSSEDDTAIRVKKLVTQLTEACEGPGFFLLKVGPDFGELCVKMLEAAKEIFPLPDHEKARLVNDGSSQMHYQGKPIAGTGAGLRPIGQDPNFAKDLREIFNISYPIRSQAEEDLMLSRDNYCGNGRNKWPKPELVSEDWRATISEYANRCWKACRTLARLFALALGVEMEYFEQPGFFDNPTCLLCMNHYHFPDAAKIWQNDNDPFGIKPHLDSGIFTLLMSDGSEGLERCINRKTVDELTNPMDRVWAPVKCPKPEEGLLIVNLGKNMDFWSGGRFKATLHRVVNRTRERRYSVPFFFEPNMDAMIRPILNTKDKVKEAQMKAYIQDTFGKEYIMPADLFFERLNQRNNKNFDP